MPQSTPIRTGDTVTGSSRLKGIPTGIKEQLDALSGYPFQAFLIVDGQEVQMLHGWTVVYYAPLSVIWALYGPRCNSWEAEQTIETGTLRCGNTSHGELIRIDWSKGKGEREESVVLWPGSTQFSVSPKRSVLADRYDRLIGGELEHPVFDLPAGSRFGADGFVRHGDGQGDEAKQAIWLSEGEWVHLFSVDGSSVKVIIDHLLAVLKPAGAS